MLDAVDEVAFLRDGRVVATGTPRRAAGDQPGVPRRGDPRRPSWRRPDEHHDAAGRRLRPRSAATPVQVARRHPRMLWRWRWPCTSLAALAALAAPRLLGDLVEAVEDGTTIGHVDTIALALAGVPGACRPCSPASPGYVSPGPGRAGARRAARGLRRQHPGPAGGRRRVRRLRRPAHPHLPRRRPARLVGALGAARVDDRAGHRGAHLRGRPERRAGGWPCPACSVCRRW